ncbi:hypothetical protein DFH08DRAFT_803936 [Mycena albidolilacea]|uniref:HAT C-terminal dimerisation domain-containing protein n=1 Tax=Mycena albidolilacea TaxID=1033008 RepID=A0AAD7AAZ6_9AGAR|nr:hypothetical protein DFH08DRAFT_803936 [Mycena albidolilacea]
MNTGELPDGVFPRISFIPPAEQCGTPSASCGALNYISHHSDEDIPPNRVIPGREAGDYNGRDSPVMLGDLRSFSTGFEHAIQYHKNLGTLKYMGCVAWDILAIPGVSISVERLFSSLKKTITDERASKTVETVFVDVVTKEWLKLGLAKGVNYMDFIKIHTN